MKELETGCWQTSSPKAESTSLEGDKDAATTQRRAELGAPVRARLQPSASDSNCKWTSTYVSHRASSFQTIVVGFPPIVPEILD